MKERFHSKYNNHIFEMTNLKIYYRIKRDKKNNYIPD
jgi:hypothetical protein